MKISMNRYWLVSIFFVIGLLGPVFQAAAMKRNNIKGNQSPLREFLLLIAKPFLPQKIKLKKERPQNIVDTTIKKKKVKKRTYKKETADWKVFKQSFRVTSKNSEQQKKKPHSLLSKEIVSDSNSDSEGEVKEKAAWGGASGLQFTIDEYKLVDGKFTWETINPPK